MRTILSAALIGMAMLAVPPAQAHPCLTGTWSAALPCGPTDAYEFGPGGFVTSGVWTGCLVKTIGGVRIATGTYELRMFSVSEGTVSIREGEGIGTSVGNVDFTAKRFEFIGTVYRR